jgi:predicted nuclease with TOPRIM domain
MLNLEKSENFQKEYNTFNEKISAVSNESVRLELQGMLQNLLKEVRYLDQQHQDLSLNNRLPSAAIDSRQNIVLVRKQLMSKLRDWEEVKT